MRIASIARSPLTHALLHLVGTLTLLASATGLLGEHWWVFDLFSHFPAQYLAVLGFAALLTLATRRYAAAAIYASGALLNVVLVAPLFTAPAVPPPADAVPLRLLTLNISFYNHRPLRATTYLRRQQLDAMLLVEIDNAWLERLHDVTQPYPHRVLVPRDWGLGMGLYSRHAIDDHQVLYLAGSSFPAIRAQLRVGDRPVTLLGLHLPAPLTREDAVARRHQLDALTALVRSLPQPAVVFGDFNLSPWSPHFRRLLQDTKLRNSATGFGLQPTWPAWFVPLLIPIDHVLHSSAIGVSGRHTGPNVGSDHYAVVVDLWIP